jgi:hypothetical protein
MRTTNLTEASTLRPRKWFQRRRQFRAKPPSREATASYSTSDLPLREFAENSQRFNRFRTTGNCVDYIFSPRKSGSQNSTGIRKANGAINERLSTP